MGLRIIFILVIFCCFFSCKNQKSNELPAMSKNNDGVIIYDDPINNKPIFKINIKDTIEIGKSTATIDFFNNNCNDCDSTFNVIIINNKYDNKIVKDTFMNEENWFGIKTINSGYNLIDGKVIRISYLKNRIYKKRDIGFKFPILIKDTIKKHFKQQITKRMREKQRLIDSVNN